MTTTIVVNSDTPSGTYVVYNPYTRTYLNLLAVNGICEPPDTSNSIVVSNGTGAPPEGYTNDLWNVSVNQNGEYTIQSVASGNFLATLNDGGADDTTQLTNFTWTLVPSLTAPYGYNIQVPKGNSLFPGLVLAVRDAANSIRVNGQIVELQTLNSSNDYALGQTWFFVAKKVLLTPTPAA